MGLPGTASRTEGLAATNARLLTVFPVNVQPSPLLEGRPPCLGMYTDNGMARYQLRLAVRLRIVQGGETVTQLTQCWGERLVGCACIGPHCVAAERWAFDDPQDEHHGWRLQEREVGMPLVRDPALASRQLEDFRTERGHQLLHFQVRQNNFFFNDSFAGRCRLKRALDATSAALRIASATAVPRGDIVVVLLTVFPISV